MWNWRKFFFVLLWVNILGVLLILSLIFWPFLETVNTPKKTYLENEEGAEFMIRSTKENLDELVNAYIDKSLKDDEDKYRISFDEEVHLMGSIEAFKTEIPIKITLDPIVQENGDIVLQSKEMALGLLRLPKDRILKYVDDRIHTPEWITINPKEENIYIAVTQMNVRSNIRVRVHQFDLENDNISFRIKIPNDSLGL